MYIIGIRVKKTKRQVFQNWTNTVCLTNFRICIVLSVITAFPKFNDGYTSRKRVCGPGSVGHQSRLPNRDWPIGTNASPGWATNRDQCVPTWPVLAGRGGRLIGPGSCYEPGPMSVFFLYLGFRVSLSPVPPLPLAGASVVSPFFASPTCSPSFPYAYYTLYYIHSTRWCIYN